MARPTFKRRTPASDRRPRVLAVAVAVAGALVLLGALPAGAEQTGTAPLPGAVTAARCAGLYGAMAAFARAHPRLWPADPSLDRLAQGFARAAGVDSGADRAAAVRREQADMALLVKGAVLYGDATSARLYERLVADCSLAGADLPATRDLLQAPQR